MKSKKLLVCLLVAIMSLSNFAAFAASDNPEDTTYFSMLYPKETFEDKTPTTVPTTSNGNNIGDFYLQEDNGNIYWSVNRYLPGTSATAHGYALDSTTGALGSTGEYVIQHKVKFTNCENITYSIRIKDNRYNKLMYFQLSNVNTSDDTPDNIIFKTDIADLGQANLPGYAFKAETWYTFRQIINLDTKINTLEIYNEDGTKRLYFTYVNLSDYTHRFAIDKLSLYQFRADFPDANTVGGVGNDDVLIAKTTHKPVTVKYDNTMGSVIYNGSAVVSESETAVPYNSANPAVFSIAAKDGYKVSDVKVNGESLGSADIDSYSFTNVKSAQTLEVTFDEVKTEAPEIAKSSILPTTYKVTEGETEKTYPAFVVYGTLSNYASDYNGEYGIYLWKGNGNRDSDALRLVVHADDENVASATAKQAFAIKLFGDAINSGSEYSAQAFVDSATGEKLSVTVE